MLTSRARRTFRYAIEACRSAGHRAVDTEHLLLGLLDVGDGIGPEVLAGVQPLVQWRQAVLASMSTGGVRPRGRMLLTPLARQVVDRSCAVAVRLGHDYIGTEHQLIALAEVTDGAAAKVLAAGGCDAATLTEAVVARLGRTRETPPASDDRGPGEDPGPTQPA
jgi:ATP-dependent Clp protease ATP-binding subunit ClpC